MALFGRGDQRRGFPLTSANRTFLDSGDSAVSQYRDKSAFQADLQVVLKTTRRAILLAGATAAIVTPSAALPLLVEAAMKPASPVLAAVAPRPERLAEAW